MQCAVPRPAFAVKHALALRRPVRLLKWKRGARALTQVTDVKRIALNTTGALRQARVRTPFNSSLVSLPRTCSAAKRACLRKRMRLRGRVCGRAYHGARAATPRIPWPDGKIKTLNPKP